MSFDVSLVANDDLYLVSLMSKPSFESIDDFFVDIEFLSKGLTLSIGLKSGFLTISGSASQKTLEELIALVNDDSLSVLTEVMEAADDSSVFVVIDGKFGFTVSVVSVVADGFIVIALKIEVPDESVFVLPRFLFAKSYMSPKIPAKVFLKFFIVSSASSATELVPVACRCGVCLDVVDVVDDCDACESRRPTLDSVGAFSVGCSGGSDETLLRLP